MELHFGLVEGLPEEEQAKLNNLEWIWRWHRSANRQKKRYYEGKITVGEVNLGIALPHSISRLEISCPWGAKTVDVLAARSMFDGFVNGSGNDSEQMREISKRNHLITQYNKACIDELEYGCAFAAISGTEGNARVKFYSPMCAAASWDDMKGQIDCGFAFEDLRNDESDVNWSPSHVVFYTTTDSWELIREGGMWSAVRYPHNFGKPLLIPMIWNPTSAKPFGQSRLKEPERRIIQGYVRTLANASIALEFSTAPQKYMLGVSDEGYDAIISDKFKQYVGSIIAATSNPETGQNPTVGQFQQGNIEPHIQMLRALATQFAAATGLSVVDVGVINDANPSSSDAILAQSQTLVGLAEKMNTGNGDALYDIATMLLAVENGTTPDLLDSEDLDVMAHFKNPAMPNVSATADAAIKIASARQDFSSTDTFLEMIGFSQADVRRIKAQEQRARGQRLLEDEFTNAEGGTEKVPGQDGTNQPEGG